MHAKNQDRSPRKISRWLYQSCHLRGFILHLDLLSKHSEGGACSCSLGLPSCANLDLAFRRIANLLLFNFDSSFKEFNLQTR